MFLEHFPGEGRRHGWIEVICGSMFSGKTEELIRRLKRAEFANQKILLVKPIIDDRYHKEKVVSHQGTSFNAINVSDSKEILSIWKKEKVVAIDEAQFFDEEIVNVCNKLAKDGVRVIIAGLDMDFTGEPFGPMPRLLSIAEYVTTVKEKEQVLVGAVEQYMPLCRMCYNKIEH